RAVQFVAVEMRAQHVVAAARAGHNLPVDGGRAGDRRGRAVTPGDDRRVIVGGRVGIGVSEAKDWSRITPERAFHSDRRTARARDIRGQERAVNPAEDMDGNVPYSTSCGGDVQYVPVDAVFQIPHA